MDRLKTITTFVQIAKSNSLVKASNELGISRALASAHLKQLEQHLGVRLFNRTTRHVSLTTAGAEYLSFCNDLLERLEAHETQLAQSQKKAEGVIKIMASMAFGNHQLAPLLTDFTALHPKVKLSLILSNREFSPSDFIEGSYDLGISMNHLKDGGIITTKIADVPWWLCSTKSYLEGKPRIERPSDLAGHNCLVHRSHAPNGIWHFIAADGPIEVSVSGSLFTNSAVVINAALQSSGGVAMLPRYLAEGDVAHGRLVRLLPAYKSPPRPIFLVYPHVRYLPGRTRLFVDYIRKRMKNR